MHNSNPCRAVFNILERCISCRRHVHHQHASHTHSHTKLVTYQGRRVVRAQEPHGLPAQACMTTTRTNKCCTNWDLDCTYALVSSYHTTCIVALITSIKTFTPQYVCFWPDYTPCMAVHYHALLALRPSMFVAGLITLPAWLFTTTPSLETQYVCFWPDYTPCVAVHYHS